MTVTLADLRTKLARRLGDSSYAIWTAEQLDGFIQEGYDNLVARTGCLWATDVLPDYASAFNYTSDFEADYFIGGDIISGVAQFTSLFERDYVDNARGPANHSFHWEFNDGYVSTTLVSGVEDLPEDFLELERATWNTIRLETLNSRYLETRDGRYELNTGAVEAYTQDKDGLLRFRKWRVPAAPYVPYSMDSSSTLFGILVQISDVTTATPEGTWGDFVQIDGQHIMGDDWGIIVGIYTEPNDVRLEYRRRALPLSDRQSFEIPDRYTRYVRHYAQAVALRCEGPGYEPELAKHYESRYEIGVQRMLKRKQAMVFQQGFVFGGAGRKSTEGRLPLARLPYHYGKVVR